MCCQWMSLLKQREWIYSEWNSWIFIWWKKRAYLCKVFSFLWWWKWKSVLLCSFYITWCWVFLHFIFHLSISIIKRCEISKAKWKLNNFIKYSSRMFQVLQRKKNYYFSSPFIHEFCSVFNTLIKKTSWNF